MRRIALFLGLAVACLVYLPLGVHAQTEPKPVYIEWVVGDTPDGGWTVGDRIPLSLKATYPVSLTVILPQWPEIWGAAEVLEQRLTGPIDNGDGTFTALREMTVTLWATGDHQMPPLAVRYRDADGELHELMSPPWSITLVSVLEKGETEKRDLKPQVSLPRPPVWPWLLGGLLLAALVGLAGRALLIRLRRRMASTAAAVHIIDPRPSHEIAYSELDRIAALNLPNQGELKRHYTLVADCLRTYIQGRYAIPAMDQTTAELLASFRQAQVDRSHTHLFRELLAEADLVKFARLRPRADRAHAAVTQARHIVDVTKIVEPEVWDSDSQDTEAPPRSEPRVTPNG
jgi:hypothetical protein